MGTHSFKPERPAADRAVGQTPWPRRGVLAAVASTAWAAATARAVGSPPEAQPPAFVRQVIADATLAGQGQLRLFGLKIYDARLWVDPRFQAEAFAAHPLALELTYHRAFSGAAIAQRSILEIRRQAPLSDDQADRWRQALTSALPDVQAGDRLTGLYLPGRGMRLWRGAQALASIDDAELARLFFGIWLSPRTSEPGLRSALLARGGAGGS